MNYIEIGKDKIQYLMNNQYIHSQSKNYVGTTGIDYADIQASRLERAANSTLNSLRAVINRQKKEENRALSNMGVKNIDELNKILLKNLDKKSKIIEKEMKKFEASRAKLDMIMDAQFEKIFSEDLTELNQVNIENKIREEMKKSIDKLLDELDKTGEENQYDKIAYDKIMEYFYSLAEKSNKKENDKTYTIKDISVEIEGLQSFDLNNIVADVINNNLNTIFKKTFGNVKAKRTTGIRYRKGKIGNVQVKSNLYIEIEGKGGFGIKISKAKGNRSSIKFHGGGNLKSMINLMRNYNNTSKIADILNSKTFLYTFANQMSFRDENFNQNFINSLNKAFSAVGYIWIGNEFVLRDVNNIPVNVKDYFGNNRKYANILFIFLNGRFYPVSNVLENIYNGIKNDKALRLSFGRGNKSAYLNTKKDALKEIRARKITSGYPKLLVDAGSTASDEYIGTVGITIDGLKNLVIG